MIYEKEENVVRISSEKPISAYVWPILTRLLPDPYNNFEYVKLRFSKNVIKNITSLYSVLMHFGIVAKDLNAADPVKMDRNKTIDCYELKLKKIGAIMLSQEDMQSYLNELTEMFDKIK